MSKKIRCCLHDSVECIYRRRSIFADTRFPIVRTGVGKIIRDS